MAGSLAVSLALASAPSSLRAESPATVGDRLREIQRRQAEEQEQERQRLLEQEDRRAREAVEARRKIWLTRLAVSAVLPGTGQAVTSKNPNWYWLTGGFLISGGAAWASKVAASSIYMDYLKAATSADAATLWDETQSAQSRAVVFSYLATGFWAWGFLHAILAPLPAKSDAQVGMVPMPSPEGGFLLRYTRRF